MDGSDAAYLAAILGALGCATLLVFRHRPALVASLAVVGAAEGLLAASVVPADDLRALVGSPLRVAAVVAGAFFVLAAAGLLARFPAVVPVAVLAAAPFRVPVTLGDQEAFLLVPLYAVLAAAALALAWRALGAADLPALPGALALPAAAFVALSGISLLWTDDLRAGTIELLFFLFPFAVLVVCVGRGPFAPWLPRALVATVAALASVFAGIGLWQQWSGQLFFAPDLEVANAYTTYFRVTSLFKDSSLYGRELVVAVVVLLAVLWLGRLRLWLGAALIGFLFAGLYFSYSQSSMAALVVAVLAVSFLAADRVSRIVLAAGVLAVAASSAVLLATSVRDDSLQRLTSGRSSLVSTSTDVFVSHPVAGVGVGAQPLASRGESGGRRETERNASHTTPLTIAAELGALGLVAYAALLLGAARLLLAALRCERALGLTLGGVFVALLVHSLVYSGFFENPVTWGVLALAAAATDAARRPSEAPAAGEPGPVGLVSSPVHGRWQT
jgi:hypothetical protein